MRRFNFNHTNYGFCKNLTEQMLASYHMKPFPVCINRPVSVGCIAKGPCPGYVGNSSGATGIILSVACGEISFLVRAFWWFWAVRVLSWLFPGVLSLPISTFAILLVGPACQGPACQGVEAGDEPESRGLSV